MKVRPDFVNLQDESTGIEVKCFTTRHEQSFTLFLLEASAMHVLCPGLLSERFYNDFKFTNDAVFSVSFSLHSRLHQRKGS